MRKTRIGFQVAQVGLHYPAMTATDSTLQFLRGQEICQIAFGMYDLQINWGNGGHLCGSRVAVTPSDRNCTLVP